MHAGKSVNAAQHVHYTGTAPEISASRVALVLSACYNTVEPYRNTQQPWATVGSALDPTWGQVQ
jgi:hypothetical protein